MALTLAERSKRFRERQRAKREAAKRAAEPSIPEFAPRMPFFEWAGQDANWINFEMALDHAGIHAPRFEDDSGGRSATGSIEPLLVESGGNLGRNSAERAEIMVGALIDAAAELAGVVAAYKRSEIEVRLAALRKLHFSGHDTNSGVAAEIVKLQGILARLDTGVRTTFPRWKVGGDQP